MKLKIFNRKKSKDACVKKGKTEVYLAEVGLSTIERDTAAGEVDLIVNRIHTGFIK